MQKHFTAKTRWGLLLSLFILGLMAALIALPYQFNSEAESKGSPNKGLIERTESHVPGLENYDIREDKNAFESIEKFRQDSGSSAAAIADIRDGFVRGENELRERIPSLKVEYNNDIRIPEVITPDVYKTNIERLTAPSQMKRSEILRNFVKENNSLIGVTDAQANSLRVAADYTNQNGQMSFAHLEQLISGVPVFRAEVKAGFTKNGEMLRVINNLAPGLDYESLSSDFRDPVDAVRSAFRHINAEPSQRDIQVNDAASTDLRTVFGNGDWATTAEKMYFPTEPGVARTAWRVLIWQPVNAFYVIVDAETGGMLWRKNITEDQTQSATYNVYRNGGAMLDSADSPNPFTPGPIDPGLGSQGARISRTMMTRIGNEAPNTFNNNGWITDGNNTTDGNAVESGMDRDTTNGVDAASVPVGNPNRVFNFPFGVTDNPGNPANNTGETPAPNAPTPCVAAPPANTDFQRASAVQMFWVTNWYHDHLYRLGFDEAARNFQTTNFTAMGVGNDRISAEGQDCGGTNNANFATPADGGRGRMQMFLWTGPTPDFDGTIDADVIIHELTHGTSNRLHGNSTGLSTNMARGMGEGWSDFYGHALLSEPTDTANGIYTVGGYATYLLASAADTSNYYYGIRRYPKAPIGFLGGVNMKPHNAYTFNHINAGCGAFFNNTVFAFARGPVGSATCDQVHNLGEIWSSALWEVRTLMVARLGWAAGNPRALQVVTDGMKLAPAAPTFLQERDAIIMAASALPAVPEASADVLDVREGFRRRGMGFSAVVVNAGTGANNTVVTEAFDFPNVQHVTPFSVSDSTGDNDGFPEPGENVLLSVAVSNATGGTVNNVMVNVNGGTNVNYGNIAHGATVTMNIPYSVPGAAMCGSLHTVAINVSSDVGMQTPVNRSFRLGVPTFSGSTQNFDGVTAPALPANWENVVLLGTGVNWVTSTTTPSSAPNLAFANDPATLNDATLVVGAQITSATAQLSFKNWYQTESTFDGMVVEYSTDGTTWVDVCPSCAAICPGANCPFVSGGYNSTISTGFSSPIGGRRAWSGNAGAYLDTVINLPAALNGQVISLRWRMATDTSVAATGVRVDNVVLTGGSFLSGYTCMLTPTRSRADFDGDGRTDLSVFRPTEGNWYLNRSTAGFAAINWGLGSDVLVPGDYDGDNKTDTAVFRASNTPGVADFYILNSNGFTLTGLEWGSTGDIPVSGDYDGDGKADAAIWRPSTGEWFILNSGGAPANTIAPFGLTGDIPISMNHDNDAKTNLAVYRPSNHTFYIARNTGTPATNFDAIPFGQTGDILVPADYDGDNEDDVAIFRPSTSQWWIRRSSDSVTTVSLWGLAGDIPVPGDYDGDGTDDIAVYRGGTWYLNQSTSGSFAALFGLAADKTIPGAYIPTTPVP